MPRYVFRTLLLGSTAIGRAPVAREVDRTAVTYNPSYAWVFR